MSRRSRTFAYGGSGALVAAGVLCAVLIAGETGQIFAIALIGLGLVAMISLVFLEVGLSEDRARDRAAERRVPARRTGPPRPARSLPGGRGRLQRMRGRRRRLP